MATKAKYTGNKFGYARERGLSGLASDGLSKVSEKATKPFKDMRNVAIGGLARAPRAARWERSP